MKSIYRMRRQLSGKRRLTLLVVAALAVAFCAVPLYITRAANPSSGTLSPTTALITYTGGPFQTSNQTSPTGDTRPVCSSATPCDQFALKIAIPQGDTTKYTATVNISWTDSAAKKSDYDLYVYLEDGTPTGTKVASSATSDNPETTGFAAASGNYTVIVVPYNAPDVPFNGKISLAGPGTVAAVPTPVPAPPTVPNVPRYQNYVSPPTLGNSAGEPSVGVDWQVRDPALRPTAANPKLNTGGPSFFTAGNQELRTSYDDCSSPAKAVWKDVSSPFVVQAPLSDPIGTVDFRTGRVFQGNLIGGEGNSFLAYSDDDGNTSKPAEGGGPGSGADHQSISAGPFNENALIKPVHPMYPNAVYYCSQSVGDASCSRSDDGGQTFGPAIPIYTAAQCGGLHGHVKIAPDGTVYVPNKGCGGNALGGNALGRTTQGVAVSEDNGETWTVRPVTGTTPSGNDPSIGIGADGTVYFGYQNGDGHAKITVSRDKGKTWSNNQDVGVPFDIKNIAFPVVVAGDADRAAFGFVGTNAPGNSQDGATFRGIWHLYIATTFDGGVTYNTVDVTPNDPVQVGSICISGTTCGSDRNLLDFNDFAVDKEGRGVLAYADGCVAPQCSASSSPNASRSAKATIARQSGGKRLFARFDTAEPAAPAAPRLESATRIFAGVDIIWSEPDNGGSPITGYNILRSTTSGGETLIATVSAAKTEYIDTTATDTTKAYFYRVTAINAIGAGGFCDELSVAAGAAPAPTPTPVPVDTCNPPGTTVATDPTGDQVGAPADTDLDIQSLSVAEPYYMDGTSRLVFTLKVANLSVLPPNRRWVIIWTPETAPSSMDDRYFVSMNSNAGGSSAVVTYDYGTVTATGGVPTRRGAADAGSFTPDGTIRITIANSKVGSPMRGSVLGGIDGRTFASATGPVLRTGSVDATNVGVNYTLVGNATAPCATATATPTPAATPTPTPVPAATPTPTPVPAATPTPTPVPAATPTPTPVPVATPTPVPTPSSTVQFSSGTYEINEAGTVDGQGRQFDSVSITVTRTGDTSGAATVDYRATDGTAVQTSDYEFASGTLRFAAGETTSKTFDILIVNDVYKEADETVNLTLSNAVGATLGAQQTAVLTIRDNDTTTPTTNPIDETRFFVRMQYLDFLAREGDEGGYDYWTQQITQCGTNQACINRKRVDVSAAFFIEQEFQDTGSFIYRLNKASFGIRVPYTDFMNDRGRVIGGTQLEPSKTALAEDFVQRSNFTTRYPASQSAEVFVDALIRTISDSSNVDLSARRSEILAAYNQGGGSQTQSRARALRKAIDYKEYIAAEFNRSFVLAEYFGYLRREPDEDGYNFWLNVLNNRVPNNYRGMVCAFSNSAEYQDRFSPVRTKTDSICGDAAK